MAAGKANFNVYKGDTFRSNMTLTGPSGTPINLSGCTITGKAGTQDFTCTIVNGPLGKFRIELNPTKTALLDEGINVYAVQITYTDTTVQTILTGNLVAEAELV